MLRSWTARAFNAFWPKVKVLNLFDDLINGEMTLLHTVDLDCMPNLKTVGLRHQSCIQGVSQTVTAPTPTTTTTRSELEYGESEFSRG